MKFHCRAFFVKIVTHRHGPTFGRSVKKSDELGFEVSNLHHGPTFSLRIKVLDRLRKH